MLTVAPRADRLMLGARVSDKSG